MTTSFAYFVLNLLLIGVLAFSVVGCDKTKNTVGIPTIGTTASTEIDDSVITTSVKAVLLADAGLKGLGLKVETHKGEVLLSGFVDTQAQLDQATAATRQVAGVKSVLNNVALKSPAATVGGKIDDGIVTAKVKAALLNDSTIKSFDIGVVTRKDEVQLSGFVDNQAQMDHAMEVARAVAGVGKVNNEMSIKK